MKRVLLILSVLFCFTGMSRVSEAARKPHRYLNIHYNRKANDYEAFRYIWTWGGTTSPSIKWPEGRMANGRTEFGIIYKIPMRKKAKYLGVIFMDKLGNKDMGDKMINKLTDKITDIYFYQGDNTVYLEPQANYQYPDVIVNEDNSDF